MPFLGGLTVSPGILVVLYFMSCPHNARSIPLTLIPTLNLTAAALASRTGNLINNVVDEAVNWTAIFAPGSDGDIKYPYIGDRTRFARGAGINLRKYGGSRWPNSRIPYYISGEFNEDERQRIELAIDGWNIQLGDCLPLVPWRSGDQDYVYVYSGEGCWSYLGNVRGGQYLSLQRNGCLSQGTIVHEFMHAAGFTHEQNRPDRDDHVTVLWDNIPKEWRSQYEKVDGSDYDTIERYNAASVMHYPKWAPETYKDAFKFHDGPLANIGDSLVAGQRIGLTEGDVASIRKLYGC